MAEVNVERAIDTVLARADRKFDAAIAQLTGAVIPRPDPWAEVAKASKAIMQGLAVALERACLLLPILAFGNLEQRRIAERALNTGGNRG